MLLRHIAYAARLLVRSIVIHSFLAIVLATILTLLLTLQTSRTLCGRDRLCTILLPSRQLEGLCYQAKTWNTTITWNFEQGSVRRIQDSNRVYIQAGDELELHRSIPALAWCRIEAGFPFRCAAYDRGIASYREPRRARTLPDAHLALFYSSGIPNEAGYRSSTRTIEVQNHLDLKRIVWIGFAGNVIVYAGVYGIVVMSIMFAITLVRLHRGLCPLCAYHVGDCFRCSECGTIVQRQTHPQTVLAEPRRPPRA